MSPITGFFIFAITIAVVSIFFYACKRGVVPAAFEGHKLAIGAGILMIGVAPLIMALISQGLEEEIKDPIETVIIETESPSEEEIESTDTRAEKAIENVREINEKLEEIDESENRLRDRGDDSGDNPIAAERLRKLREQP